MSCGPWRGVPLVVPVGGALDHLGISAEGGIVHERAATDGAPVDPQFFPAGEGIKAGGGVLGDAAAAKPPLIPFNPAVRPHNRGRRDGKPGGQPAQYPSRPMPGERDDAQGQDREDQTRRGGVARRERPAVARTSQMASGGRPRLTTSLPIRTPPASPAQDDPGTARTGRGARGRARSILYHRHSAGAGRAAKPGSADTTGCEPTNLSTAPATTMPITERYRKQSSLMPSRGSARIIGTWPLMPGAVRGEPNDTELPAQGARWSALSAKHQKRRRGRQLLRAAKR